MIENSFHVKFEEIKNRETEIIEGTKLKKDFEWLIEKVETLDKISELWCEIEFEESELHPRDFYGKVQDILSGEEE